MHQQFYSQDEGFYCGLFEDDENTFALRFYRNNKPVNAILSDMSKNCREDFFNYLQKRYYRAIEKFPNENKQNPIYFDLTNLIEDFSTKRNYHIHLSQEKRKITEEDFLGIKEEIELDYIVLKELSKRYYLTKKGVLVERETK